jgi:hypothetical protein
MEQASMSIISMGLPGYAASSSSCSVIQYSLRGMGKVIHPVYPHADLAFKTSPGSTGKIKVILTILEAETFKNIHHRPRLALKL